MEYKCRNVAYIVWCTILGKYSMSKMPDCIVRKIQLRAVLQFYVHSMCKHNAKLRAAQINISVSSIINTHSIHHW